MRFHAKRGSKATAIGRILFGRIFATAANSPANPVTTQLRLDADDYEKPLNYHGAQFPLDFAAASKLIRGSRHRIQTVIDNHADFVRFGEIVGDHIAMGSFSRLPRVKSLGVPIPRLHKLTVGVWEAVFLCSDDNSMVIGLVFSKAPHDYSDALRLGVAKRGPQRPQDGGPAL